MRWTAFLLLFIIVTTVHAQISFTDFDNSYIYQTQDGLPSNKTYDIIEDSDGFLWIATGNGVSMFDGKDFVNFSDYLEENKIRTIGDVWALTFDIQQKYLFISTDAGVLVSEIENVQFRPINFVFPFLNESFVNSRALFVDTDNILWVGTTSNGLYSIDLSKQRVTNHLFAGSDLTSSEIEWHNSVRKIITDQSEPAILWIGTDQGLVQFNRNTSEFSLYYFNNDKALFQNIINEIIATESHVYVGSNFMGWFILDKESESMRQLTDPSDPNFFYTITGLNLDESSHMWITSPQGLKKFDLNSESVIDQHLNDRISNDVKGMTYVDSRGILWYCDPEGLIKYNFRTDLEYVKLKNKSRLEHALEIKKIIRKGDHYFIGANFGKGIYKVDTRDYSVRTLAFPIPDLQPAGSDFLLKDMVDMGDGKLLLLGYQKTFILDTYTETIKEPDIQVPENESIFLHTAVKDHDNNYFLATNENGLYKINYEKHTLDIIKEPFKGKTSRDHNYIKSLAIDSRNKLWIGQSATSVMDPAAMDLQTINPDLDYHVSKEFGNFLESSDNRMWIANVVDGLSYVLLDDPSFNMTKVSNEPLTGVYEYNDSLIWTLTNGTPGVFNIRTLQHENIVFQSDKNIIGPVHKTDAGSFMFGVDDGVLIFHPWKKDNFPEIPEIYLQQVISNKGLIFRGKDLNRKHFSLEKGTNQLRIKVAALAMVNPESLKFQIKINDAWLDLDHSGFVNWPELRHGNHELQIRSIDNLGVVSRPNTYTFYVEPYWYASNTAMILYFLLFGILLFALNRIYLNRKFMITENKRIKELEKAKSNMYANISHEFRTPLTMISGFAEILMKKTENQSSTTILKGVQSSSDQLLHLVNQMLDLSSFDANRMTLTFKNADIVKFIQECIELYLPYIESKLITMQFESNEETLFMDFDDDKLQKVLNNLLSNAIKFTPENGVIRIVLQHRSSELYISISDTGKGIVPEIQDLIFDRFFNTYDLYGQKGCGIGLALAKEITQLMGGKIELQSAVDEGSTFTIVLPVCKQAEQKVPTHQIPFIDITNDYNVTSDLSVISPDAPAGLLVEDNRLIRNFIKTILGEEYRLFTAVNGAEGLKIAQRRRIDFIISDLVMPEMDGYAFCEAIKSNLVTSHIPFIILSARTGSDSKKSGYDLGVDAYLTKPFSPEELKSIVRNLLKKQQNRQKQLQEILSITSSNIKQTGFSNLDFTLILRLQKLILDDSANKSADQIARELLMSRTQLHRKIKSLTGKSLTQYANYIRIEKAKKLLLSGDYQIKEIAYMIGFESSTYFIRLFKDQVGLTPESFRMSINK